MAPRQDPAVQRRRLRVALRDLRQSLNRTQKEVADALDWSPSKLIRIENGSVTISRSDLIAILDHYGVNDQARVAELVAMAQTAKQQSWAQYRDVHPQSFLNYLEFESAAHLIRSYEPLLVPGLLQTEEYANATIRALAPEASDHVVQRRVEVRMERQELLRREEPPQIYFIMDEAVVRRRVGQGKVMIRQLEQLREAAQSPRTHLQILPFSAGLWAGMREAFVVLDFPDPADDDLLYIERENLVSRDKPEEVEQYNTLFFEMQDVSTPPGRAVEILDRLIEELEGGRSSPIDESV